MTDRLLHWWPAAPAPPHAPPAQARQHVLTNLALDEAALLMLASEEQALLRAYCNPTSVILGLSRHLKEDVNEGVCNKRGVPILRRASGGGTVMHDPFVLNVAWILPWSWLPGCGLRSLTDSTTEQILTCLIDAIRSYGIGAKQTRISDLSTGNPPRKFAGSGQMRKSMGVMHHISILCDLDLSAMNALLPNPPDRPDIDHKHFVTSLKAAGVGTGYAWGHDSSDMRGWQRVLVDLERRILSATCAQFEASSEVLGTTDIGRLEVEATKLVRAKYADEMWIRRL